MASCRLSPGAPKTVGERLRYNQETRDFVRWYRQENFKEEPVVLEDSVGLEHLTRIPKDNIWTRADRDEIADCIKHPVFQVWTKDLTGPIEIVPVSVISAIFAGPGDSWELFHARYKGCLLVWGQPIFVHNYSYCLFYSQYSYGWLEGTGSLSLFKKVGNKWVLVKDYGRWIS